MSTLRTRFALAAGTCALGLTLAPAASANSIDGTLRSAGAFSYSDGSDRFCVTVSPNPSRHISARVAPVRGNNPSFTVTARSGDRTECKSLMYAYEDSAYTVTITGSTSQSKTHRFWT
ncbi:hypothetical protein [Janibacter sp. GS2]|uniref:hypothetical protein n=1 Tax=Janibacter sp. GS2 TaxID=3442646 RepID=UPI003EB8B48F